MKNHIKRSLSVLLAAILALTAVSAAFAGQFPDDSAARAGKAVRARTVADATATDATATDAPSTAAVTENGVTYIVSNGQAVIIAVDETVQGDVVIPEKLGGAPVGVIGMGAFKGKKAITSVKLPDSVTVVDEQAFADCAALERIEGGKLLAALPESAYAGCDLLDRSLLFAEENENFPADVKGVIYNKDRTELICAPASLSGAFNVPLTVKYVRAGAFRNCVGLTEIVFINSSTEIGAYAFAGCTGLTKADLPSQLAEIREGTFAGCKALNDVSIPSGLTAIGDGALENCVSLPQFIVPINCVQIGKAAFKGCAALVKVTCLSTLTALSDELFAGCTALKVLELQEGVTSVGEKTFYNCAALEDFGDVLRFTQVGRDAFTGTAWYAKQADGPYIAGNTLLFWKGVCDAVVDLSEKKITAIAPGAFSGSDTLVNLTLPESVTSIGESAFENCTALASVTFNGVALIGARAFEGTAFLASANGAELYLGANLIRAAAAVPVENTIPDATATDATATDATAIDATATDATAADATATDATATDATATDIPPADTKAGGRVYTVRQNVKSIAADAFLDADPAIEEIVLPEGLLIVSDGAFDGLPALKTVNKPSTLTHFGWQPSGTACGHASKTVKYADEETCTKAHFTGCTYCTDCAALLEIGALREAAGHRFAFLRQEADPTLGEVVVVLECSVCKAQKRVPLSEYNVRYVDNDKAEAEGDTYLIIVPGATMADVLKGCPAGTLVLNAAGERLSEDAKPGSGMQLLFPSYRTYTIILYGDTDGDGNISSADARTALRRSVKLDEAIEWRDKACHVKYDGKSDVVSEDARLILRASVQLEDPSTFGRVQSTPTATDTDVPTATDTDPTTETPSENAETQRLGEYLCTEKAGVYLREGHSRSTAYLDVIRDGETITVTEVWCDDSTGENVYWGKVEHNGKVGWTMLEYYEQKQQNA